MPNLSNSRRNHAAAPAHSDPTTDRILDATRELLAEVGPHGFTVEHVAARAGVARVTVYRRFTGRDDLVSTVLLREAQLLLAEVDAAVRACHEPQDRLVEGFVAVVRTARDHPLLRAVFEADPSAESPITAAPIIAGASTAIAVGRSFLAATLRDDETTDADGQPVSDPRSAEEIDTAETIAEIVVRLTVSFLLIPDSVIELTTDDDLRRFARRFILPALAAARPHREALDS
jgi:AcrR family transcriptional regulator